MPLEEIMRLHDPDYPFCVGWANHDWSNKTWEKSKRFQSEIIFLKQEYLGSKDYTDYFYYLLPMFKDERYIKVDNKPLFYVYDPEAIPNTEILIKAWNKLAKDNGLNGIYFIGRADPLGKLKIVNSKDYLQQAKKRYDALIAKGYNAVNSCSFRRAEIMAEGFKKEGIKKNTRKNIGI